MLDPGFDTQDSECVAKMRVLVIFEMCFHAFFTWIYQRRGQESMYFFVFFDFWESEFVVKMRVSLTVETCIHAFLHIFYVFLSILGTGFGSQEVVSGRMGPKMALEALLCSFFRHCFEAFPN